MLMRRWGQQWRESVRRTWVRASCPSALSDVGANLPRCEMALWARGSGGGRSLLILFWVKSSPQETADPFSIGLVTTRLLTGSSALFKKNSVCVKLYDIWSRVRFGITFLSIFVVFYC